MTLNTLTSILDKQEDSRQFRQPVDGCVQRHANAGTRQSWPGTGPPHRDTGAYHSCPAVLVVSMTGVPPAPRPAASATGPQRSAAASSVPSARRNAHLVRPRRHVGTYRRQARQARNGCLERMRRSCCHVSALVMSRRSPIHTDDLTVRTESLAYDGHEPGRPIGVVSSESLPSGARRE